MPITIGSNINALGVQRRLAESNSQLSSTFERLSSGQRINRASDDAAGLAISDALRASSRVYTQGIRNLNDGLSLLNIADGAIEQLSVITIRLTELAEQTANGTYSHVQRKALDAEAQALAKEYFRIARATEFNGLSLFTGTVGQIRLQGGFGLNGGIASGLGGALGTGTFQEATSYTTESNSSRSVTLGDLNGDGVLDLLTAGSSDAGDGYATVRLGHGDGSFGTAISYATESRRSNSVTLGDLNGDGVLDLVTAGYADASDGYATVRLGHGDGSFGTASSYATESQTSHSVTLGDLDGDGVLDLLTAGMTDAFDGYATTRLSSVIDGIQPLLSFSLRTLADARQVLPVFQRKREQLASQRGTIGAFQSRIAVAVNVLQVSAENFRAAESRIRDADIADESSKSVRLGILQQASSAVLAQANHQPALALQLLT